MLSLVRYDRKVTKKLGTMVWPSDQKHEKNITFGDILFLLIPICIKKYSFESKNELFHGLPPRLNIL